MDVIIRLQLTKMNYDVIRNKIERLTKSTWLPLLTQDNHWKDTLVIMYLKKIVVRNEIPIVIVLRKSRQMKDIRTRIDLIDKRDH